jgi:hypothetical protein
MRHPTSVLTAAVALLAGVSLAARTDGPQAGAARAGAALDAAKCAGRHDAG